jgi:hypothetical protein
MKKGVKNFFLYICLGFFVIFLMSLAFPQDICGSEELNSSPRIFFMFAMIWLGIFYFINKAIKNIWKFLLIVVVVSFIFEYFFVNYYLRTLQPGDWGIWFGMSLYWVVWFGATRLVFNKMKS